MVNSNKRRRLSFSPEDPTTGRLIQTFDKIEPLLCELITASKHITDLPAVLGAQRANFITALRSMIWVTEETSNGQQEVKVVTKSVTSLGKRPVHTSPFAPKVETKAIKKWPPQLPEIENPQYREFAFAPDSSEHNFQRMEYLGDSYLQMISSHILYDRFPNAREGPLSDMRSALVANRPLSEYARLYNFSSLIRGSVNWKVLADSFEAYVAGVILSDPIGGVEKLKEWLGALYEPKIAEMAICFRSPRVHFAARPGVKKRGFGGSKFKNRVKIQQPLPMIDETSEGEWEEWDDAMMIDERETVREAVLAVDKGAKNSLKFLIAGDGATVKYVPIESDDNGFEIVALLSGWGFSEHPIGQGWGVDEEEACHRAAMNVLTNETFCEEMKRLKNEYQESIKPAANLKTEHQESSKPAASPPKNLSPEQIHPSVEAPAGESRIWKEIDGVIVLDD